MSTSPNLQTIKDWFTLMVAIIVTIAGVIFWVQSINDPKFEKIEQEKIAAKQEKERIEKLKDWSAPK